MSRNEKNKSTTQMADKKWFIVMLAVIVCFAFSPPQAGADTWLERQKLLASDGTAGILFGRSVSISGNYAIVGASSDDDNGGDSGSAYIFNRDGTNWVQQQKLTASDGAASDQFGYSVSISGDYAIVGAYGDDDKGSASGSAYIFKRDGTSWVQQQKLLASADGATNDYFGRSVSISGDYAIAGAYGDDDKGSCSGSAYIFKRDGTSWSEQAKSNGMAQAGASRQSFSHRMVLPMTALAIQFLSAAIMQSSGRIKMTATRAQLIYSIGMGQFGFSSKSFSPRMAFPVSYLAIQFLSAAIMQSSGRFKMTTTPARLMRSSFARGQTLMMTVRWISLTLQSLPIGGYTEPIKR
ncbi:MAG: FG-GAP repeat protein [Planctomycetota bacterium]|nr:FG-GAP repeat protein [Planctomycetota bacterium]